MRGSKALRILVPRAVLLVCMFPLWASWSSQLESVTHKIERDLSQVLNTKEPD